MAIDLKSKKVQIFKSTGFPSSRSQPYSCSWSIKVNHWMGWDGMGWDGMSWTEGLKRAVGGPIPMAQDGTHWIVIDVLFEFSFE